MKKSLLWTLIATVCLAMVVVVISAGCRQEIETPVEETSEDASISEEAVEEEMETKETGNEAPEEEVAEEPEEEVIEEEEEIEYEIIFYSDHGSPFSLYSCKPDGSDRKKLYDSGFDDLEPCWNNERDKIVFPSSMDGDSDNDLWVLDLNTGEVTKIVDLVACDLWPIFSPSGAVVFTHIGEGGNSEIYSAGSPIVQLTDDPAWDYFPHFSPDGETIIFTSDRSGTEKLYTMDKQGNNIVQISGTGNWSDKDGTFSPDGKNIIFVSDRSGNEDIWVMPVDDPDSAVNLTNNPADDMSPDWSPDGSMVVFVSDRDADETWMFDIFTMNANGENQVNITPDLKDTYQDSPNW